MAQSELLEVARSCNLNAPAATVWALIGDFNAMPNWHPGLTASRLETDGGATWRRVSLKKGMQLRERLDSHSDTERVYAYSILEGPLPISDYHARICVKEAEGGRCIVEWSSQFFAAGVSNAEAEALILSVYEAGLDSLTRRFPG